MQKILLLALSVILSSCASTMPGQEVGSGTDKITVSLADNETFTNERIQMHQFSIRNNTKEWMEFEGAKLEGSANISVLVGDRISSWVEACTLEKQVSDYNTSIVLGSLMIAGAAVAGGSQHQGTATTGAVIALGSISAAGVRGYQDSKNAVEFQQAFPDKHIFRPFTVPPGKVVQRWILIENQSSEGFALTAKSKDGFNMKINVKPRHITPPMVQ